MNTIINYLYRDAANYKAYPEKEVITAGELTWADFKPPLHMGEMFIPGDLDLPELQFQLENYPNSDDHIWHQLLELEPTKKGPTVDITAAEISRRLEKIAKNGWNESAAFKRHNFLKVEGFS